MKHTSKKDFFTEASLKRVLLFAILMGALLVRLFGYSWDQGHHLHPDERFLTMVSVDINLPAESSFVDNISNYLDPAVSTLNPYNTKHQFYVYGTFPVTINKLVADATNLDSYEGVLVTGRFLSAFADLGTVLFVYLIAALFRKKYKLHDYLPHIVAFMYAVSVLPIQHAHFFTVDSFATFFGFGALFFALKWMYSHKMSALVLSAVFIGIAGGTKVSSIYIAPLIGIIFLFGLHSKKKTPIWKKALMSGLYVLVAYASLRIADPRLFADASWLNFHLNPIFKGNVDQLRGLTTSKSWFPPNVQWFSKEPLVSPLINIVFFGLGAPLFIASMCGMYIFSKYKHKEFLAIVGWVLIFFAFQGTRFVTTMRYFYILYPFLALFAGFGVVNLLKYRYRRRLFVGALILILVWPMSFMMIYTRKHSRVAASEWIYQNIPAKSVIATEHWDDPLPLHVLSAAERPSYSIIELPVFGSDTREKWQEMNATLDKADYYILSSNRAYGSILAVPDRYPLMVEFYNDLFEGRKDFELVGEFTSYPTLPLLSYELNDQWADEAFTVYDHPRVLIYKKR